MSSIIIATVPIHGHVIPLLAVARHFAERGDRVRFVTGARFADAVAATGAEHIPLPPSRLRRPGGRCDFPERAATQGREGDRLRHRARLRPTRPGPARRDHGRAPRRASRRAAHRSRVRGRRLPARPPPRRRARPSSCAASSRSRSPAATPRRTAWGSRRSRGPLGRLRNALLSARRRAHRVPAGRAAGPRGQPRAARPAAAVPGPRLAAPRRGDRAVHRARVRVPPLRRPGDPALRRSGLGHRLRGAAAALVGRARRLDAGRPRHPGHDREPRLPADHRPDPRGPRRGRRARRRVHRRPPARHAPAAARQRPRRQLPALRRAAPPDRRLRHQRRLRRRPVRPALRRPGRHERRPGGQARGRRARRVVRRRSPAQERDAVPAAVGAAVRSVLDDPTYRERAERIAESMAARRRPGPLARSSTRSVHGAPPRRGVSRARLGLARVTAWRPTSRRSGRWPARPRSPRGPCPRASPRARPGRAPAGRCRR